MYHVSFLFSQRNIVGNQCVTNGRATAFSNLPAFLQILCKILFFNFMHCLFLNILQKIDLYSIEAYVQFK
jgi:hypothetical protein